MEQIHLKGAREHTLKNLDLSLPRNQRVVITGLWGSGTSSLAFDTLCAEGPRRSAESLSAYARQFLDRGSASAIAAGGRGSRKTARGAVR